MATKQVASFAPVVPPVRKKYVKPATASQQQPNRAAALEPLYTPSIEGGKGGSKNPQEDLLQGFKKMSPQQRKEFLDTAAAHELLQTAERDNRDSTMWSVAVYDAFCVAVGGRDVASVGPAVATKLLGGVKAFAPVQAFMNEARVGALSVTERQAVYMLLADLLINYATAVSQRSAIPLTIKLVANCVEHVRGLFGVSFPGYMQAGLTHVVARQFIRQREAA